MRYANVVSSLALFLSLGGVSYAVTQIDDNSVTGRHVVNAALTGTDIKSGTLFGSDVADESLNDVDIKGPLGGITYFKFFDGSLTLAQNQVVEVLRDTVRKGDYFIEAQASVQGGPNAPADVQCIVSKIEPGSTATPPLVAKTRDTQVFPGVAVPELTVTLSGVFEAKADGTALSLACRSSAGPVNLGSARMTNLMLRDLQIDY